MVIKKRLAAVAVSSLVMASAMIGQAVPVLADGTPELSEAYGIVTGAGQESSPTIAFATRLYEKCLEREPEANGLAYWDTALRSKTHTGAQAAQGFVFSEEYKQKNTTDEEYVEMLYNVFMDRASDAGGKAYWLDLLSNGVSREYVFRGFTDSQEFTNICKSYDIERGSIVISQARDQNPKLTAYVNRMYTKALDRAGEESGLNDWCNRIQTGSMTPEQVAESFINSKEFRNKNLSNEDYVKVLYRTFMGREYDEAGLEHWKKKLTEGSTREELLHQFATSQEFKNIVASFTSDSDAAASVVPTTEASATTEAPATPSTEAPATREADNRYCPVTANHHHTYIGVVDEPAWDEYETVDVEQVTPVIVGYKAYTQNGTCLNDVEATVGISEYERLHCPNACMYGGDTSRVPDPIPGSCTFQGVRHEPIIEYRTEIVQEERFVQHHEEVHHSHCDSCGYDKY